MVRSRLPRRKRTYRFRFTPRTPRPCPCSQTPTHRPPLAHPSAPAQPISLEEFTNLVAEALDTLPQEIIEKLENVAVTVEEQASPDVLAEMGLTNPCELLGAYRGIPRPWRSMFAPLSDFPDKIEIYYWPIVRACPYPHEIKEIVRRVVVHEVGHHFGMSDQQLRALGY
ncbi:MAG: metallopeptidase family protein [Candidatus Binatia bacterium]|nr:metallopeptidase family protein [Candidatus Binatia bacterium]